jgi:serine-type anaerobic sulfatase-maturating enzyme
MKRVLTKTGRCAAVGIGGCSRLVSSAPPRSLEVAAKDVVRVPIDDPADDGAIRAVERLEGTGAEWTAVTSVHAGNAARGRAVYRGLRDECGARSIEFVPLVEQERAGRVSARSVDGRGYGRFLIDVFEEWVRRDVGTVSVQMFDSALANWAGTPPAMCVHSETCGTAPVVDPVGDVYSCARFIAPEHRLGSITMTRMLDLVESPQQRRFGEAKRDTLPHFCLACDVRFACHGGCPKDRFAVTPGGEAGLNYLCDGLKAFFHHVDTPMQLMATFVQQGRSPAQIMSFYRAADAERDRNELCTCGSGRKWKRCHGMERPLELVH